MLKAHLLNAIVPAMLGVVATAGVLLSGVIGQDKTQVAAVPIVAVPSPSELSCPLGWLEAQRSVVHVDGGGSVGFIACDLPGKYSLTRVMGGGDVLRDWQGREVTDPNEFNQVVR